MLDATERILLLSPVMVMFISGPVVFQTLQVVFLMFRQSLLLAKGHVLLKETN